MRITKLLHPFAFAGLLSLGACESQKPKDGPQALRVDVERYQIPLEDDDYALGGEDALVTIVVFSDYGCGPCKALWEVMGNLHEDYGDDIRIVSRTVSVRGFDAGERAIEAAFAAGAQGKFWPMHWRLFEHQEDLSEPVLRAHAKALGLDLERFNKELDEGVHSGRTLRDRRKAKEHGIIAAPIVYVNGMVFVGPRPDETMWHKMLDAEITTVREQVAAGLTRKGLYASIQSGALDKPLPPPDMVKDLQKEVDAVAESAKAAKAAAKGLDPSALYNVPLEGAASVGPVDAPFVIIEFTDFQCPFCRKLHLESLKAIRKKYPNEVRVVSRNMPLEMHQAARGAAKAVMAAGKQGQYWAFHDFMFERNEALGLQTFKLWAKDLGLDVDRFESDFNSPELEAALNAERALVAQLGLSATPSLFVNGRYFEGFLAEVQIEELMAKAKAAQVESGVAPSAYYAELMKTALGPSEFPNAPKTGAKDKNQAPPNPGASP